MSIVDRLKSLLGSGKSRPGTVEKAGELWSPELGKDYRSFWDRMAQDRAGAYLAVAGEPFGKPATEETLSAHGKDTAAIIAEVLEIGPEDRVLEVGVGVGRIAEHLAPRCQHFTGIDISENMIRFAKERLARSENVTLIAHQKSDLSIFPEASFDKVYFQVVLIHLDREDAFHYLGEAARVLRPGGRAWFQFYNLLHPGGFREFEFAVKYMLDKGGKTRGRVHCYTAAEVRFLVEKAGFRVLEEVSALSPVEQKYRFQVPDRDWEHYLIAVGEKPGNG